MSLWGYYGSRCSRYFRITPCFINPVNFSDWHSIQKAILCAFRSWQLDVRVKNVPSVRWEGLYELKPHCTPNPRVISRRGSEKGPTLPSAALWALTWGRIETALCPSDKGYGKESIIRSHGFPPKNSTYKRAEIDEKFQLWNKIVLTIRSSNADILKSTLGVIIL